MSYVSLSKEEKKGVKRFLEGKARELMEAGADYALVFRASSGIGRSVTVTVKGPKGEVLEMDVTDYSTW